MRVRSLFSEGPLHIPYVSKKTAPHIPAPPCSPIPLRLCVRHEHTGMFRGPLLEPSAQSRGYLVDHTCQIIVQWGPAAHTLRYYFRCDDIPLRIPRSIAVPLPEEPLVIVIEPLDRPLLSRNWNPLPVAWPEPTLLPLESRYRRLPPVSRELPNVRPDDSRNVLPPPLPNCCEVPTVLPLASRNVISPPRTLAVPVTRPLESRNVTRSPVRTADPVDRPELSRKSDRLPPLLVAVSHFDNGTPPRPVTCAFDSDVSSIATNPNTNTLEPQKHKPNRSPPQMTRNLFIATNSCFRNSRDLLLFPRQIQSANAPTQRIFSPTEPANSTPPPRSTTREN